MAFHPLGRFFDGGTEIGSVENFRGTEVRALE
jgi:hypothetical protein